MPVKRSVKTISEVTDILANPSLVDRWMDASGNTRYCSDGEKAWYYKGQVLLKRRGGTVEIFNMVKLARVRGPATKR